MVTKTFLSNNICSSFVFQTFINNFLIELYSKTKCLYKIYNGQFQRGYIDFISSSFIPNFFQGGGGGMCSNQDALVEINLNSTRLMTVKLLRMLEGWEKIISLIKSMIFYIFDQFKKRKNLQSRAIIY